MDILPIPLAHLDDVWPHVWPHLRRGVDVCGRSREALAADILADRARVWIASSDDGRRQVHAAWLTEIVGEDGVRYLAVFGLGGQGAAVWAEPLEAAMVAYARAECCKTIRFNGSRAWGRHLPRCKPIRRDGDLTVFEREAV